MSYKLYYEDDAKQYFIDALRHYEKKSDLNVTQHDNAIIAVNTSTTAYGIFDADNKIIPSSIQMRGHRGQFIPTKRDLRNAPYMDTTVMFMGNIYPHFGHFMLEHMNRAYAITTHPCDKYVFIDNRNIGAPEYVYEFMSMLGIARKDVLILTQTTRFKRVVIPAQSLNIDTWYAPEFVTPFGIMRDDVSTTNKHRKIYVSRAKLAPGLRVYGEEKIQEIFRRNGFDIIYPETLPLREQIRIVANADTLAGCAGTALHLALFMRPNGTVIQLKRNRLPKDSAPTQYIINESTQLNSVFISASIEETKSNHYLNTGGAQIIGMTPDLRKFMEDNGFELHQSDFDADTDAINEYTQYMRSCKTRRRKFKRTFIKIVSCLVPGRINRARFRNWLKRVI